MHQKAYPKESLIRAVENTDILAIDAVNNLQKFIEENPPI
jgi:hypothetical protein